MKSAIPKSAKGHAYLLLVLAITNLHLVAFKISTPLKKLIDHVGLILRYPHMIKRSSPTVLHIDYSQGQSNNSCWNIQKEHLEIVHS